MTDTEKGNQMTSGKKSKAARKDEKAELIEDLTTQIDAAVKAQTEKLDKSKEHLVAQLRMASEKYLTVNGYMQARSTFEQASFGGKHEGVSQICANLALDMSKISSLLADKIEAVDPMDLDESVIEGHLDKDFVSEAPEIVWTVKQLLIVNLLQNIGPSIDDIVSFREGSVAAIEQLNEELAKHLDGKDADKPELSVVQ